jgi:hypothetical protein
MGMTDAEYEAASIEFGQDAYRRSMESLMNDARRALNALTDEQRADLFAEYCKFCGSKDPRCQCMNDE